MERHHVASIGKCTVCGAILCMDSGLPFCPACGKKLNREEDFGSTKRARGIWEKIQWIGPDGNWTKDKPKRGFVLGGYNVTIE